MNRKRADLLPFPVPGGNGLSSIFAPRGIAVVGASNRPGSVGGAILQNLGAFEGVVVAVNPKHTEIRGRTSVRSLLDAPREVDLAVIATPAATVPGVVRDCVSAGIPAAIIISAGFKETGTEGARLEAAILDEARKGKLRFLGPNCLGAMVPHAQLNATFAEGFATPGSVAFLSQSGALCSAVLDWSYRENVGFSAVVSVGSMLDVGWGDLLTYFGDEPNTKSILCYMESVGDARSFLSAAREVALSKPIIILKVGHTGAAAKAAASHTGALTGSDAVLDAAFRRVGVLRVDTIGELFDMAAVLDKQPRPNGPSLAIVTNAGGAGALATDTLVASGGTLASLQSDTIDALNPGLPEHWSRANPVDIIGDADAARYARSVEVVARDPQTDGVLVILTPQAMTDATATAHQLRDCAGRIQQPVLASWMGGPSVQAGKAALNAAGIPTFDYPDDAARAFVLMWRYSQNLRALYETPTLLADAVSSKARTTVEDALRRVRSAERTLLTEVESKQILKAWGIRTVETRVATTKDDAARIADEIGYPVVLKLLSETITHKSEVGGVRLDLRDATAVRNAWQDILDSVTHHGGSAQFSGVTVQPMIARGGFELILGSSIDPQFGPVLLFGAGGRLVEVFKDTALGLPPLNTTLAHRLMEQTRIHEALARWHDLSRQDLDALAEVLVRFSQLVAEQPWISEIDINPLLVSPGQIVALDARIVLHPSDSREDQLPRLAIRPYPTNYISTPKLKDGSAVTLRPIRPEDEPLMVKFHKTLSDRSVYLRYLGPLPLAGRIAHERLSRICFLDCEREIALVAERTDPHTGQGEIVGVGRMSKLHASHDGEFALLVGDAWQGRGVGTQLLQALIHVGRQEKLDHLFGLILGDNYVMRRLAEKAGFALRLVHGTHEYVAELILS